MLFTSSYLQRQDSQILLKLLSQTSFKEFLSSGLPDSVLFSHKYGEDAGDNIYSDSGIVYLQNRPYMLTVMFHGINRDSAKVLMKQVSGDVYGYMSSYGE